MQKALITGGSSGIGLELAKIMAAKGHDLVLVARNLDQLETAKKDITSKHKVNIVIEKADLSLPGSAQKLYQKLKDQDIEILVNNAGVGLKGDFFSEDLDPNRQMAYLNMNSLMELTHYFGNDFIKKGRCKILNVGSIAAYFPGPKQPVYYATKAFVRSFTRALAYNLKDTGVTVTALHPGVTKTNFFNSAKAGSVTGGASAKSVAELGYKAMMSGKVEVTHGIRNKFLTNVLVRIIPYRLQTMIVDKVSEA